MPTRNSTRDPWGGQPLVWKRPSGWKGLVTSWLRPHMRRDGRRRLRPGRHRDICWDDEAWLDIVQDAVARDLGSLLQDLADDFRGVTLRTYHGTRTADAGVFFREGLRVHDRAAMTRRLMALTGAGAPLDRAVAAIGNEHDVGRLYLVADDRVLMERAAHYMIYGSEWMLAVSDAPERRRLKEHGAPTLLEIDLPLSMANCMHREAFARVMIREWARLVCNRSDWTAPVDFTFCLDVDLPPASIVGHRHPTQLRDPIDGFRPYRSECGTCRHCAPEREPDGTASSTVDANDRVDTRKIQPDGSRRASPDA